jgi:DNA polymerase-3 subunit chi
MPQVDFYILPDTGAEPRLLFACRLAEKAYRLGHAVHMHTADAAQAQALDDLLWRFQATSFVPHALAQSGAAAPVQIGCDAGAGGSGAVLINLALQVPAFFANFSRVSEIVVQMPEVLQSTRSAWRFYQQQGCALERHDMRRH